MLKKQLLSFCIVGAAAFLVHYFCVVYIVETWDVAPLKANIIGFSTAFPVSYWGHYKWTYNRAQVSHKHALPKFFFVASAGFALNEFTYSLLLDLTRLAYNVALFVTLVTVALSTFIFSKFWAFRGKKAC